jgi:hypothetical protein
MATRLSPPKHPRPMERRIESAKRAIPEILLDQPAVDCNAVEIPSNCLIEALRDLGHPRGVAEHAIFDLYSAGLLEAHWPRWEPLNPLPAWLLAKSAEYKDSAASINSGVILAAKQGLWTYLENEQHESALTVVQAEPETAELSPGQRLAGLPDNAMLNHLDLANLLTLNTEVLRKRLDRWRAKNEEGWQHVHEPASHEPKYLYRIGAVREVLNAAIASAETSG